MKRVLTPQIIAHLDGKAIRLSSPYAEGQLLSVNSEGVISLESPDSTGFDQHWRLLPTSGGFQIVSAKYGFKICHQPQNGGIVSAIKHAQPQSGSDCVWKVGKEGEIYQPDSVQGGERYLWLAGSHLYATYDGFLAERWSPYLYGEKLPPPVGPQYPIEIIMVGVVLLILGYLFWFRKS